jgi:CubicO group peptidase (beta-lactamase class C family)
MTHADATAHWTDRLTDLATASRVPGAVLGILAGGHQTIAAHGVLSNATGVPVTGDAVFQIGSITKPWTGTMIMQLVDEGKLSLDTTVADVLPGIKLGETDVAAQVAVRHLLTHTSGVDGDIFTDTGRGGDCIERYVADLAKATVTGPAGAAYSYCNSGFVVLGRIIEVLDGAEWDESLRKRIIEPLGLRRTVTLPEEAILHRAAVGHRGHPHLGEPVGSWGLPRSVGPAGLITASVGDVLTFAKAHLDGGVAEDGTRLLSSESAAAMLRQTFAIPGFGGRGDGVGLTWRRCEWDGRTVFGHDGSTVGQTAYLRVDPQAGVIACLLTNTSDSEELYQRVFGEVFESYCGVTVPSSPEPVDGLVLADVSRHAGRYERTSRRFDVAVTDDGGLHAVVLVTGELAVLTEAEPEEFDLLPADSSGDNFVCRSYEGEPWTTVSFSVLDGGQPYLFTGGRVTLRAG